MRNGSPLPPRDRSSSRRQPSADPSKTADSTPGTDRFRRFAPAVIAAVTVVAFGPALAGEFVSWDDARNFLENTHYRGLGPANLAWMWTTFHLGHYIPLSWMTLGVDYLLWGMQPAGYHATSILIHAANAVAFFFLARHLLVLALAARPGANQTAAIDVTLSAAFAALLFAVHPLRVESVAWITERRDVLSMFFMLISTLAYLRWCTDAPRRRAWYGAALLAFACALLSKATAMTLPAVFAILNVFPFRRAGVSWRDPRARSVVLELAPFAALSAGTVVLSIVALHPPAQLPLAAKAAVTSYGLAFYLWKTAVPFGLAPLYEMPQHVDPWSGMFRSAYLVAALFLVAVWGMRKRWPAGTASLLAFLLISLPMLGVVQNGPQIVADRYTYHAAPALALFAGGALFFVTRLSATITRAIAAAMVLSLAALTANQSTVWRDSTHLWERVLAVDSNSAIAHSALASLAYRHGRVDEGMAHSIRAVTLAPNYAEAHNDVGVGLARQGRLAEAADHYRHAVELQPTYDEGLNNLGVVTAALGDVEGAVVYFRRAIGLYPDYADAHVNWGNALVRLKRPAEAVPHYQQAITARPDHDDAHHNWGVALAQQGQLPGAVEHFRQALAINPNNAEARVYLDRATQLLVKR